MPFQHQVAVFIFRQDLITDPPIQPGRRVLSIDAQLGSGGVDISLAMVFLGEETAQGGAEDLTVGLRHDSQSSHWREMAW